VAQRRTFLPGSLTPMATRGILSAVWTEVEIGQ